MYPAHHIQTVLLSAGKNPFELDPMAFQNHPIRILFGLACLALAAALTVYAKTYRKVNEAKRKRAMGDPVPHTRAEAPSHRKKQKGERRYGSLLWMLFFPNYKGGDSRAKPAQFGRKSPDSYKETWGSEKRYGFFHFGSFIPFYKGGESKAKSARFSRKDPDSYKQTWGSEKRYGFFDFGAFIPFYKGGESKAKSAKLSRRDPNSYKQTWGSEKRYGTFLFGSLIPFYRGHGSKAGTAHVPTPHQPNTHNSRLFSLRSGWSADTQAASYKGGFAKAGDADLRLHLPISHRSRPIGKKQYYHYNFGTKISSYSSGRSAAGEGRIPLPHVPTSHGGWRLRHSQLHGWRPFAALASYKGGFAAAGEADLSSMIPGGHRRPSSLIPAVRYGIFQPNQPAPSYKGGFAAAKPARMVRRAPQSHRFRFPLTDPGSKRWSVPVNSYKGGYGIAGVGRPIQELPMSYKEPWGFKARYYGFGGYRILPIRLDGSPWPEFRHAAVELPRSYKEPWGFKLRYYGLAHFRPLPIHLDGAPQPDFHPIVELPRSYKEPWGLRFRYGKGFPLQWHIPGVGYQGGSRTRTKMAWQDPETGAIYHEHLSNAKRYGTHRYGGKLYAHRSIKHYQNLAPVPDTAVEWRIIRDDLAPQDQSEPS